MHEVNFSFLGEISRLIEMFEKQKLISGEEFNIFTVMSMESDEVFTHSALIAELLNPTGKHSLGSKPLELFVLKNLSSDFKINYDNATSKKEEHIGFKNEDNTEGGRIDIVIKDSEENMIIIENKIYASEQINQLERYKNRFPKAELLYLTLDGKEGSTIDINPDKEKIYKTISYKENIIVWINECAKLAFDKPMVREVLNQYNFLLKKLTKQSTNIEMSQNIHEIIKSNLRASYEIYKNYEDVLNNLKINVLKELVDILKLKHYKLDIKLGKYKGAPSVDVLGLIDIDSLHFRFKGKNLPVLSIRTFNEIRNESLLHSLKKENVYDHFTYWKIFPIMDDVQLFETDFNSTVTFYANEISNIIVELISQKNNV